MDKVKINKNGDGTYNLTLPGGGQSQALSAPEVVQRLKTAEQEFQNALSDVKTKREFFEKKAAQS